jgi:hypothetical protein
MDLPFQTTAEVTPLDDTIGQPRALDAIAFGLEIDVPGYNLFVTGTPGSGRESTVQAYLARVARTKQVPADWVYVHNFTEPDRPRAIRLPAGQGGAFARHMDEFITAAQREIPRAFDSEDYERRRRDALAEIASRREALLSDLQASARAQGFVLEMTSAGIVTVPLAEGHSLSQEEFARLEPAQRQDLERRSEEVGARVAATVRQVRQLEKEASERVAKLDGEVARFAVGPLFDDLREQYHEQPDVLAYVEQVQNDLPQHLADFRPAGAQDTEALLPISPVDGARHDRHLARYRVNVLIDNGAGSGAPVVVERNPTYYNLAGRIEYRATFGAMVTDFHQIKPGALHRANGGFLVLHIVDVLQSPFAWEVLKRALRSREIRIEGPDLAKTWGTHICSSFGPFGVLERSTIA